LLSLEALTQKYFSVKMTNPLLSIIVPCYNQAQYLSEALQSVLDQTYKNWECVIVNDGSPDNTEEVAKVWLGKGSQSSI
jgi:hypothetical protein